MFRYSTIIREILLNLAKVIFMLKHSVKLRRFMLCGVGTAVAQWLRCCATNRKMAGSIPDGVIGIFH
jgi:hypothetical protein